MHAGDVAQFVDVVVGTVFLNPQVDVPLAKHRFELCQELSRCFPSVAGVIAEPPPWVLNRDAVRALSVDATALERMGTMANLASAFAAKVCWSM